MVQPARSSFTISVNVPSGSLSPTLIAIASSRWGGLLQVARRFIHASRPPRTRSTPASAAEKNPAHVGIAREIRRRPRAAVASVDEDVCAVGELQRLTRVLL